MKHLKKLASTVLALLMVAAMMIPAFAQSLTIAGKTTGHSFNIYQIFTGTADGDRLKDVEWGSAMPEETRQQFILALQKDATLKEVREIMALNAATSSANDVAAAIQAAGNTQAVAQAVANAAGANHGSTAIGTPIYGKASESAADIVFTHNDLVDGYYLIADNFNNTTKYMACPVLGESNTINLKTEDVPPLEKQVLKYEGNPDNPADWGVAATYPVPKAGQEVDFRLVASLPSNFDLNGTGEFPMTFHDDLAEGVWERPTTVTVTFGGVTLTTGTDYTLTFGPNNEEGTNGTCDFHVSITDLRALAARKGITLTADTQIIVQYKAKLLENAVIGTGGNKNTAWLEGDDTKKEVTVYTFELDIFKYNGDTGTTEETRELLSGAEFTLSRLSTNNQWTDVRVLGVDEQLSKFEFKDLAEGYYRLEETRVPTGGYTKISNIYFQLTPVYDAAGNLTALTVTEYTADVATDTNVTTWTQVASSQIKQSAEAGKLTVGHLAADIYNFTGVVLPSTGGIGTTIFYIAGGILAVGAVILLVTKRRMGQED